MTKLTQWLAGGILFMAFWVFLMTEQDQSYYTHLFVSMVRILDNKNI